MRPTSGPVLDDISAKLLSSVPSRWQGTCISPELKPETLLTDFTTLCLSFNLCEMDKMLILLSGEDSMVI